ncbi:MAG: IS21 family transposase [Calothrix sp. SM1_5_4]|nr:IS21 family transposase [Calothrix sp. SM1_5_4]
MAQVSEIERLIKSGLSDRVIARSIGCRRSLVKSVRSGDIKSNEFVNGQLPAPPVDPATVRPWVAGIDWECVERDIRDGHQIKRIWEEVAAPVTSHPNFFKYVKARFAPLLTATITLREFKPGEHCEVDYAGDKIPWVDRSTGEIRHAHVFVGILCFSQKIFAHASENEKKANWLDSHRRMFEFYRGVAKVLVPDQLKNGVIKSHLYDPDLNPDYVELAAHYCVAVVPARRRKPKDKALVEGAVGILMRYFRFTYRRRMFTSLAEINQALAEAVSRINAKIHTRFKTSREDRFTRLEKPALQALPLEPYSLSLWKDAKIHQDCTVAADQNFYSAPHIHRGREVRVKITATKIEIFLNLERIAMHARERGKIGERITKPEHLPPNARAYHETTPRALLAQARFSHVELHSLIDELFQIDTLANLRRAQGLVRKSFAVIQKHGRESAGPWIAGAVQHMRRFNRVRVKAFEEFIQAEMKKANSNGKEDRSIARKPGNPMVRGLGTPAPSPEDNVPQLRLIGLEEKSNDAITST